MAHSALHFTVGVAAGSAVFLRTLVTRWRSRGRLSPAIGRWLLVSYGLGFYAIVPSLLHWAGVPKSVTGGWWMNIFILHPALTRLRAGGMIPAGFAILFCFVVPYAVLLAAILRTTKQNEAER